MQFLRFEDAVAITRQLEDFFNSPESDSIILELSEKFNLRIKNNFIVSRSEIEKNCSECMGCHNGSCILGCFIDDNPNKLCYWDEAIERIIGTNLITHEMGHKIYDNIFENDLSAEDAFNESERFAQFFEDNFHISIELCQNCSEIPFEEHVRISNLHLGEMLDQFVFSILGGVGFGIGSILLAWAIHKLFESNQQEEVII